MVLLCVEILVLVICMIIRLQPDYICHILEFFHLSRDGALLHTGYVAVGSFISKCIDVSLLMRFYRIIWSTLLIGHSTEFRL